ncbi:hypothetical protein ACFL6U_30640 [Planctomycetota bacterium]
MWIGSELNGYPVFLKDGFIAVPERRLSILYLGQADIHASFYWWIFHLHIFLASNPNAALASEQSPYHASENQCP